MPTPSSRMVSDCSNNSQSMPRARNISAVVRPPMPPPTMIAFMRVTPHSLPQPRLAPLAGRGRIASAMRSIVRCDPGEGVLLSRRAQLAERAPHPNPLPAKSGAREHGESLPSGLFGCKRLCRLGFQLGAGFRLTLNFEVLEILPVTHAVAEDLFLARQILWRTGNVRAIPSRRPHREGWIDQMRPGERDEVGAAGGEDGVDLICGRDVPDAHGRDPGFVADLIGEWRLEHPAVNRLRVPHGLARGDVDQIDAGLAERTRDRHRVVA